MLGGNPKSISKIYAALKQEPSMPVVIFKGTGEAADLLAYAVRFDIYVLNYKIVFFSISKFLISHANF